MNNSSIVQGTTDLQQFVDFLKHAAGDEPISDQIAWDLAGAVRILLGAGKERTTWALPLKEYTVIKSKLNSAQALLCCALAEVQRARTCHERLTALRNSGVPLTDPMVSALALGETNWLRLKQEMNTPGILIYLAKLSTAQNIPLLAMSLLDHTWLTLTTDSFDSRFTTVFAQLELCHKNHYTNAYKMEQTLTQSRPQLTIEAVGREHVMPTPQNLIPRIGQHSPPLLHAHLNGTATSHVQGLQPHFPYEPDHSPAFTQSDRDRASGSSNTNVNGLPGANAGATSTSAFRRNDISKQVLGNISQPNIHTGSSAAIPNIQSRNSLSSQLDLSTTRTTSLSSSSVTNSSHVSPSYSRSDAQASAQAGIPINDFASAVGANTVKKTLPLNGSEKSLTTKALPPSTPNNQGRGESFVIYMDHYARPYHLAQSAPVIRELNRVSNGASAVEKSTSAGQTTATPGFVWREGDKLQHGLRDTHIPATEPANQRTASVTTGHDDWVAPLGVPVIPHRSFISRQPSRSHAIAIPPESQTPLRNVFHAAHPLPSISSATVTANSFRPYIHAPPIRTTIPAIPPVNRKTIARDILRALGASVPQQHTGKRKRGKTNAIPTAVADVAEGNAQARKTKGRKSARSDQQSVLENADAEILSPAVLQDALLTSVRGLDSDATIAPTDTEPGARPKEPPLFWSDNSSNENLGLSRISNRLPSGDTSEADVDALLGRASPSSLAARAATSGLTKSSTKIKGIAWPVDRVTVELPMLPKGWLPREKEATYGEFEDFKDRLSERKCEWCGCPAVLNSEQQLATHWDKIHWPQLSETNANCECKWHDCTLRFSSTDKLRRHIRLHVRDHLRCAYQDCDFQTRIQIELADHVHNLHVGSRLRPITALRCVAPMRLPELPSRIPSWQFVTPLAHAPAMSPERHQQLGNWVLFKISGKIDLEPALNKVPRGQRRRKDYVPQSAPRIDGRELELQQQYLWTKSDERFKGLQRMITVSTDLSQNGG